MKVPSGRFLDAAVKWLERNRARLASVGVDARLVGPTTGRSKNSLTAEFVGPDRLVGVTIWDSGEVEVITTLIAGDDDSLVTIDVLSHAEAVASLLDRVATDLIVGT
jgi:hypothetical protein